MKLMTIPSQVKCERTSNWQLLSFAIMFYFDTNTVFPTCVDMFSRDAGCVKLKGMHYYRHTCVSYILIFKLNQTYLLILILKDKRWLLMIIKRIYISWHSTTLYYNIITAFAAHPKQQICDLQFQKGDQVDGIIIY